MVAITLIATLMGADAGAPDYLGAARALAAELGGARFTAAVARFEPEVAKRLTAEELARQWKGLTRDLGAFKAVGSVREEAAPKGRTVFVECVFERGSLSLKVGLDERLRVGTLRPVPGQPPETFEAEARALVGELAAGGFDTVVARFSEQMSQALPAQELGKVWESVTKQSGAFQKVAEARVDPQPPLTLVDLTCTFAREDQVVRVVLTGALKVDGLFFLPAWKRPDYADPGKFEERPLQVGTTALPLPGTLTVPKGKGPFPAVVLVHGSGPNDADESLGPNRLFKDLAWGLASRKVAVLRYPKRTFHYRGKLSASDLRTVKEETIDDALSAVAALAQVKEVDPARIFVLGHSMGAGLAPRMAAAEPKVHGVVLLAGATRKQWHLVVEQVRYLTSLRGAPSKAGEEALRRAEETAKKLDDEKLSPEEIVDGAPGAYWLDLRGYDETGTAAALDRPILVLQGERDYQVTMTDFAGWKKALAGRKNATLKSYPTLNHHFMPGTGKSSPAEYGAASHAAKEVVEDLARWLTSH